MSTFILDRRSVDYARGDSYRSIPYSGGQVTTQIAADLEKVKTFAEELRKSHLRSPREKPDGYVIAN